MYNPLSLGNWRPILHRQPPGVTGVALTFDDGPTPATTPKLIELLGRAGAKATFFLSGTRVAAHPDLVAALVAAGHQVFGHGWEHLDLEAAGPERAIGDMQRVERHLARHRPTPGTYLVRLPYNAGYNRAWMHRAMARFHPDARFAWCAVNTHDYELAQGCRTHEDLLARGQSVADQLAALPSLPGSILLLHENPFGASGPLVPQIAETFLPLVLAAIARRGLSAAPIKLPPARNLRDRFIFLNVGKLANLYPAPGPALAMPGAGGG